MTNIVDNRFKKLRRYGELKRGDAFTYAGDTHVKIDDNSSFNLTHMFLREDMKIQDLVIPVNITITIDN